MKELRNSLQSEDDAGKVRDEEEEDDGHEDHRQVVLEAAPIGIPIRPYPQQSMYFLVQCTAHYSLQPRPYISVWGL